MPGFSIFMRYLENFEVKLRILNIFKQTDVLESNFKHFCFNCNLHFFFEMLLLRKAAEKQKG